jgi:cytochrome d ubiquinol oxidase subunit II
VLAVLAVVSVVGGWGVAQYPYLLGTHLRIAEAAAPTSTLWAIVIVFGAAAVLCVPSLALLYMLQQRGTFEEAPI